MSTTQIRTNAAVQPNRGSPAAIWSSKLPPPERKYAHARMETAYARLMEKIQNPQPEKTGTQNIDLVKELKRGHEDGISNLIRTKWKIEITGIVALPVGAAVAMFGAAFMVANGAATSTIATTQSVGLAIAGLIVPLWAAGRIFYHALKKRLDVRQAEMTHNLLVNHKDTLGSQSITELTEMFAWSSPTRQMAKEVIDSEVLNMPGVPQSRLYCPINQIRTLARTDK